jgi:hypothetical protein
MPVSDEVKKTQKVNKGPSAFERVKAKYGKSVMNVGKKKVKEELDLTQVAEALGGYVVEARRGKRIPNASGGKKTGSLRGGDLEFPGDRTGATQQAKADIEARKGFKKNKPGGLKDDERNPYVKREVRQSRVDDLGGNIFDAPKVTDKDFKKSLKDVGKEGAKIRKARRQAFKDVQTDPEFGGGLEGSKPTFDKKGKKFEKPEDPYETSKTPIGSLVKKFEFQPRDRSTQQAAEKTAKSFKQFTQDLRKAGLNIQDYRDRDIATMRTGPSKRTKPDITGTGGRNRPRVTGDVETRQDPSIGMAPPDEPRVKNPSYRQFQQYADQARRDQEKLRAQRDAARNPSGMDKDKIRSINKQITGAIDAEKRYTDAAQGKGTSTSAIVPMTKTDKKGRETQTNIGAYLNPNQNTKPVVREPKGGSIVQKSFSAYSKLAKRNPAVAQVTGFAGYDIGKGILGKIKKGIVGALNVQKSTKTGRISAGT